MLHVLDFEGNIIDFISDQDNYLENALMVKDKAETLETFEFDIDSDRAENMRERNRIIVQDSNNQFREFIIVRVEDDLEDRTFVECNASYLEDINTAKPLAPGKYEAMTTSQALKEVLKDTGWQASEATEYGGSRTTTWTAYNTPYEVLKQLGTTYDMEIDFYIELGSNKVKGRYVEMHKPKPLFKGKEITYGKDLTSMSKTVDISELHTALMALGPEDEDGNREVLTVVDDNAHRQFGLPNRYIWGIYEPQSEDINMTTERLKTLATTQLNKDKQAAVSYEITAADISQQFPHEKTSIGDIVRVKDREFNPPLYIEAEVVREEYNPIKKESTYTFGNIVEYLESTLRKDFMNRLNDIRQKMNDSVTNLNTIIEQTTAGNLETFERKIFKSDTAPTNPVNDMLWYDTSNPEVAVLRRYWNGEWREETVSNVEQIGGVTREKALFSELNNTFINLNIQHSKLLSEVYEVISSEYLVDTELKQQVQQNLDSTINVYNAIKTNLESMTPETATIGKLVDTQALFLKYRNLLQTLYNSLENAKILIDDRFKLLQSQYTDEKFNEAMQNVATGIGGTWNAETGQLIADIPNQQELEDALKTYINGQDAALKQLIDGEVNSKITQTKNELNSNISAVSAKVDGIQVGGRNLVRYSTQEYLNIGMIGNHATGVEVVDGKRAMVFNKSNDIIYLRGSEYSLEEGQTYTFSFYAKASEPLGMTRGVYMNGGNAGFIPETVFGTEWKRYSFTFVAKNSNPLGIHMYPSINNGDGTYKTFYVTDWQLEKGNIATDVKPSQSDVDETITKAQTNATAAAKAYADAQDALRKTEVQAYADGIVTEEEKRAIADAQAKLTQAKAYADTTKAAALAYTDEKLIPITSTQTKQSTDIKQLQDGITLKADKTEITTMYDKNIKPLETKVNDNTAELKVQADQISSKVANSTYTADVNNIVTRLNSADTQRTQLSNAINDRVTIKEYTDNKTATTNQINTAVNNVQVGGRNLLRYSTQGYYLTPTTYNGFITTYLGKQTLAFNNSNDIMNVKTQTNVLEKGQTYTFSFYAAASAPLFLKSVYLNSGHSNFIKQTSIDTTWKRYNFTFTAVTDNPDVTIHMYPSINNGDGTYKTFYLADWQLEKGNKMTDVRPAPEDTQAQITKAQTDATAAAKAYADAQDALRKTEAQAYADGKVTAEEKRAIEDATTKLNTAKAYSETKATEAQNLAQQYAATQDTATLKAANQYTDDKKAATDQKLITMQTQINQNGTDINARATKEEFNSSRKTLSKVVADLTVNTTTGLTLSYDENGNIQSHTVGPDGIMLNGDRVNINVNKDFQVLAGNVSNKVGKDEIINRLNLSPEGLDINVNNVGIRGGDSISYVNVKNDTLELNGRYNRIWRGTTSTNTVNTVMKNGYLSFSNSDQNKKLSISDFGISTFLDGSGDDLTSGTIEFFSTEYSSVRGLTLFSAGVLGLQSNSNQIMIDSYASTNIESRHSPIYFRPYKLNRPGNNAFALTVANETLDYKTNGYIMYGSDVGGYGSGLRFYKASSNPRVEVVDGNSTGGGITTIEAGTGEFNLIKRRTGNDYIGMQSFDILIAGSDTDGDRLASNAIYKRTYSYGANVYVTSYGTLGRATSASKYKLDIDNQYKTEDEQLEHSKSILDLNVKHWFDKTESETYAKEIEAGKRLSDDFFVIKRHSGLIAEDVENAGLSEFVTYGSDGEIEGIQYDRLWVHLIPVIKQQQQQIKQLEEQINESK